MRQSGKTWVDHNGREMPSYAISPVLKLEDKHANIIAKAALRAAEALRKVDEAVRTGYEEILEAKLKDAKIYDKAEPNAAGGMTVRSFDRTSEVKITKPASVYFDETYTEIVKRKFDEYFSSIEGDEQVLFLRDIVSALLFSTRGNVDMSKVLILRSHRERLQNSRKLREKGKPFIEAMDIYDNAIRTKKGNMGIYVSQMDENGKMRSVPLKYMDV